MENSKLVKDITALHNYEAVMKKTTFKINGQVTDRFRIVSANLTKMKREFAEEWGPECLSAFMVYSSLKVRLEKVANMHSRVSMRPTKGQFYNTDY